MLLLSFFWCTFVAVDGEGDLSMPPTDASPLESIGQMLKGMQITQGPRDSPGGASIDVIASLAKVPAPEGPYMTMRVDPKPSHTSESCDRDYGMLCPEFFQPVGVIHVGGAKHCAPSPEYVGPCTRPYAFTKMTIGVKARWQDQCQAYWPCVKCSRFQTGCPAGWTQRGESGSTMCAPEDTYGGNCGEVDFAGYTKSMMDEWSSRCGAFWPCDANTDMLVEELQHAWPISMDATLSRISRGMQA